MDPVLDELRRLASERFGLDRAGELEPLLEALRADLDRLAAFPLDLDDGL